MQILESTIMGKNIDRIEFHNNIVHGHYIEIHFINGEAEKYYSVLKTSSNKIESDMEYEKIEYGLDEEEIIYGEPVVDDVTKIGLTMPPKEQEDITESCYKNGNMHDLMADDVTRDKLTKTVEQQIFDNKIKKLSEIIWEMLRHYTYTDHIEQPNLDSRKCFCRNCIIENLKQLNH